MKKLLTIGLFAIGFFAYSQVTFRPGIRAGMTISKFTGDDVVYGNPFSSDYYNNYDNANYFHTKSVADFYIGFQGNICFAPNKYALQPEINYTQQGTEVTHTVDGRIYTQRLSIAYVGAALVNKFYVKNFNIHLAPAFDVVIYAKGFDDVPVDISAMAGVGYDFTKNFGVELRVKKGFIAIVSGESNYRNLSYQGGIYYSF